MKGFTEQEKKRELAKIAGARYGVELTDMSPEDFEQKVRPEVDIVLVAMNELQYAMKALSDVIKTLQPQPDLAVSL